MHPNSFTFFLAIASFDLCYFLFIKTSIHLSLYISIFFFYQKCTHTNHHIVENCRCLVEGKGVEKRDIDDDNNGMYEEFIHLTWWQINFNIKPQSNTSERLNIPWLAYMFWEYYDFFLYLLDQLCGSSIIFLLHWRY